MEIINHECYVSLEVAKLLKEAGFDWECKKIHFKTGWKGNDDVWEIEDNNKKTKRVLELDYCLLAPTLDVAQRWLREVKGCILEITAVRKNPDDVYKTYIEYWYNIFEKGKCGHFNTYEESQEAGEKKALEIILFLN